MDEEVRSVILLMHPLLTRFASRILPSSPHLARSAPPRPTHPHLPRRTTLFSAFSVPSLELVLRMSQQPQRWRR